MSNTRTAFQAHHANLARQQFVAKFVADQVKAFAAHQAKPTQRLVK